MSFYKTATLQCDGEGNHPSIPEEYDRETDGCVEIYEYDGPRAMEARENAAQAGWTYENGKDYCPECSEDR
jgi:hypothetical protein